MSRARPAPLATFRFGGSRYAVVSHAIDEGALARLTAAEREVAELIARGHGNEAIARARGTSIRTVSNQVSAILRKLGASSRFEIAARLAR